MTFKLDGLWVARVAKILALLFFFLPWVVVSCNGDPLVQASGFQLASGQIDLPSVAVAPDGMGKAWWAMAAIIVILVGLAVGFVLKGANAARAMAVTSLVALVLVCGGLTQMVGSMRSEVAHKLEEKADSDDLEAQLARALGQAMRIEVDVQSGYWLTVLSLLSGAGAGLWVGRPVRRKPTEGEAV